LGRTRYSQVHQYRQLSTQAGLDDQIIEKILGGAIKKPHRVTLVKIADVLRLGDVERATIERLSGHTQKGFLKECRAIEEAHDGSEPPAMSMRRAVLFITAPEDPLDMIYNSRRWKNWSKIALRAGSVFGVYDIAVRVTTPPGTTVFQYGDDLFREGSIRTIETIPLRDDMPIYLDKAFSNEHLKETDYHWAMICLQALGGERDIEFPQIFFEVAEQKMFWGGVHLLTAATAVGQYDSVVEVLVSNLEILKKYVRKAQNVAKEKYSRDLHMISYVAIAMKTWKTASEF
jgi:hypothetical protein